MNQEYYIGQIFEGSYSPDVAVWCNANEAYIEVIGDHRYEIKAIPPALAPTHEEVEHARASAYATLVDPLHARKARKTVLGEWTDKLEAEYVAKVKELSDKIVELHPYPEDLIPEPVEPAEEEPAAEEPAEEPAVEEEPIKEGE